MFDVYQRHTPWHVTIPCTDKKQPRRGKDSSIDGTKGGTGNKEWHDPAHNTKKFVSKRLEYEGVEKDIHENEYLLQQLHLRTKVLLVKEQQSKQC